MRSRSARGRLASVVALALVLVGVPTGTAVAPVQAAGATTSQHSASAAAAGPFTVTPTSLEFGSHVEFSESSMTVTLENGDQAQTLGSFGLDSQSLVTDSSAIEFTLRTDIGCPTLTMIEAGAACDLTVDFRPVTRYGSTGNLHWLVGDTWAVVTISGTGTASTGVTWSGAHNLRSSGWTSGNALARSVSGSTGYLHAVLTTDKVGGKYVTDHGPYLGVYYRRSSSGGASWGSLVRLNPKNRHGDRASIATSGRYVYATWVSQTKYVRYSRKAPRVLYVRVNAHHGSGAWRKATAITSLRGRVDYPVLAASGASVYVAYTDASTGRVRVAISRNHGRTWSKRTLGSTTKAFNDGKAGYPSIAASGSLIVVAWLADQGGTVTATISGDRGATWHRSELVSASPNLVTASAAAGRASVAWISDDGVVVRTWQGGVWGGTVKVQPPASPGFYAWHQAPAIAMSGASVTGIAWGACRDECSTTHPLIDLVWAESADGGSTFPARQVIAEGKRSGPNYAENSWPSVVFGSPTVRYVMYQPQMSPTGAYGLAYSVRIRSGSGSPN